MTLLDAIATGAAGGAVAAVAYFAHALGRQGQMLIDHDRRITVLEGNYDSILGALHKLHGLIVGNGA